MAGRLRKFRVHGAYKTKSAARKKERSSVCGGECFIRPGKVRGRRRWFVLQRLPGKG